MLGLSELRAFKVLGQPLSTQRYKPVAAADERDQHSVRSVDAIETLAELTRYKWVRIHTLRVTALNV